MDGVANVVFVQEIESPVSTTRIYQHVVSGTIVLISAPHDLNESVHFKATRIWPGLEDKHVIRTARYSLPPIDRRHHGEHVCRIIGTRRVLNQMDLGV